MNGTRFLGYRDVSAERALVRKWIEERHHKWRRHGIGLMQSYVSWGRDTEVRIHVWHPDLKRAGMTDHGDIHDHRFTLRSTVLAGELLHQEAMLEEDANGDWDVLQVLHARENPDGKFSERPMTVVPGPLVPTAKRVHLRLEDYRYQRGDSYEFERGHFHRSVANDVVVTLITKTHQVDAGARVIARHGTRAVEAFDPSDAENTELTATILRVLEDAAHVLTD